jgi:hypothetical protein
MGQSHLNGHRDEVKMVHKEVAMRKEPLAAIEEHFSKVSDPRVERTKEHKLIDIMGIAICAVICGAEGWVDIELFGKSKLPWLKTFLELPNGIPSHDTFGRVFSRIDVQQFQLAFYESVWAVNGIIQGQIINLDGKQLRGSKDKVLGKRAQGNDRTRRGESCKDHSGAGKVEDLFPGVFTQRLDIRRTCLSTRDQPAADSGRKLGIRRDAATHTG